MKKSLHLVFLLFVAVLVGACNKPDDTPKPLNLTPEALQLVQSSNAFGLDLFAGVLDEAEPGKNVMISPLSVSLALSMTYNGAAGDTRTAFEQTLRTPDLSRDQINRYNQELVTALLAHDPKVILEIANSIWYRNEYQILPDFIERNQTYYSAEVNAADFINPATLGLINGWVDEKTHSKIEKIIDQINPESFMFLINAIYFKGAWEYEFDKKETSNREFYLEDGSTVTVPMMNQEIDLNMFTHERFVSAELPYGKGNWSMLVFLPLENYTVEDVVGLMNEDTWSAWMKSYLPATEVNLYLPRFQFAFDQNLNNVLTSMGLGVAFTDGADFSDIAPGLPLAISKVLHKTFIDVNEEGTEAAAVTSVEIGLTSTGNYFMVNKPFLFAITERSTGAILFIGKVLNPNLKE